MPGCGQIGQCRALPFPLLHAVFAEVAQPCLKGFANLFGRVRLGDADQRDFLRGSSSALGGSGDPLV